MSRLRERLYKQYKLQETGLDFMGYGFKDKKELSTHHILPRHSGGKSERKNLCVLNRYTSHNYIHLIENTDFKIFLEVSKYLLEQVKMGQISKEKLLEIDDILKFFEYKYRDEEARNGELLIKPEYKKRLILEEKDEK